MNLQQFCSKRVQHIHYGITAPFSKGEWTYATDGVVCIRVPRCVDVASDKGPEAGKLFDDAKQRGEGLWQSLPLFEVVEHVCKDCSGFGLVRVCNYCKNFGCKRCNDTGHVGCDKNTKYPQTWRCEECYGSGKIQDKGNIIVDGSVEKVRVSAIYLSMIKDLPNVMIAPFDAESMFQIGFDGGEGLLMPMRM